MKKNKLLLFFVAIALLFTLSGCGGAKQGEVAHDNYIKIIEGTTTYDEVIVQLGAPNVTYRFWENYVVGSTSYDFVIGFGPNEAGSTVVVSMPSNPSDYPANSIVVGVTLYTAVTSEIGIPTASKGLELQWTSEKDGYDFTIVIGGDNLVHSLPTVSEAGLFVNIYSTPIGLKTGVWEWIILQIGKFTFMASNLFGLLGGTYLYWIGLLIMTLTIRTLAWPVYAKSNDLTIKMQLAQPELNKVQDKYKGKTDQASQQRMQMETMEIYKRYKINVFGCLMPFMQMPIFIAMYQVVQRFPLTSTTIFGSEVAMNTNFLWTHLGNTNWLPNLPLAIIVAGTMFLSQWLTTKRTQATTQNQRYQSAQAQQSQKTMKYMMYFMVVMMGYISILNAGIAFYWIIGNAYQLFQSYISHRNIGKRKDKLSKSF